MKEMIFNCLVLLALLSCGPAVQTARVVNNSEEVNVGYGTMPRDQISTSVSSVSINENIPYTTIYEMIQGKCAGVQVSGESVIIRGVGTINLSSQPLFVVDGVEMFSISHINPRDVKDIQVLKDSAASIYGSRGANGVILITLK